MVTKTVVNGAPRQMLANDVKKHPGSRIRTRIVVPFEFLVRAAGFDHLDVWCGRELGVVLEETAYFVVGSENDGKLLLSVEGKVVDVQS